MAEDSLDIIPVNTLIKQRWKVIRKLGEGGFGAVYAVFDEKSGQTEAMKVEPADEKNQVLRMEVEIMRKLKGKSHATRLIACAPEGKFNYVVMTLVGNSLSQLRKEAPKNKFSISTSVRIGKQCLEAIQDLHSVGYLHRDIKPSNFAIGQQESDKRNIYMLDFGLARYYLSSDGTIRTPRYQAGFRGTVRYASPNCHNNQDLARHDDIWSLLYMLIEMVSGGLPWRKLEDKNDVGKMKKEIQPESLCSECPPEFIQIYKILMEYSYVSTPEYQRMQRILDSILERLHIQLTEAYDWEKENEKEQQKQEQEKKK